MPFRSSCQDWAARCVAAIAAVVALLAAVPSRAQVADPRLWGVDGSVNSIVRIGGTLYVGGRFTAVGPNTGGGAPVDRASGAPLEPYPRVNGRVSAVVSDGAGGWFVGGRFSAVGGAPRADLAHVLADGSVAPWSPSVVGEGGFIEDWIYEDRPAGVNTLVLRGNTLYVGGQFTSVNGTPRENLAAIDRTTGALLDWNPSADGEIHCLVIQGNTMYLGGEFQQLAGIPRHYIAAFDLRSGRPTAWDPDAEQRVRTIVVDGHTVYAGGDFETIGGQPRNCVAALDAETGTALPWDVGLTPKRQYLPEYNVIWPAVTALAVRGHEVYVSGVFDGARGQARAYMAAFDTRSGAMTGFAPNPSSWALTLVAVGNVLYAGGDWYSMGDAAIPHVAALDARTGEPTPWNPRANGLVEALAVDQDAIFVGGSFTSLYDWRLRNGIVAIDLASGRATDWDPHIDGGSIDDLVAMGDTLYMAGVFKGVGGEVRGNIAAVDARTGAVTSWNPGHFGIGGPKIVAGRGYLYLLGAYETSPHYLVRVDPVTAAPATFDAQIDGPPDALVETNGALYLAGGFAHLGGQFRAYIGAVDSVTGLLRPWDPYANPDGLAMPGANLLAARGNTIYMGGSFFGTNYFPRAHLAAVDATTGALRPWAPRVGGDSSYLPIRALMVRDDAVWVGGGFTSIDDQPRENLAVLDATTGAPLPTRIDPDGGVYVFATSGDTVYVGGAFQSVGGVPHTGIASFVVPRGAPRIASAERTTATGGVPAELALGPARPNPARAQAVIEYALPHDGAVRLAVFDLAGRRVATLRDGQVEGAGSHTATLATALWRSGVYFCRIDVGGATATRKFLVVQ